MGSRLIIILALVVSTLYGMPQPDYTKTKLPSKFVENRIYVTPVTEGGDTLKFYIDTGGGANMIYEKTVDSLGLPFEWFKRGNDSARLVIMPKFIEGAGIPSPVDIPPAGNKLLIAQPPQFLHKNENGFLGRNWFATRIWEFDYINESLSIIDTINWNDSSSGHRVELGFQTNEKGNKTTNFPRITIEVDGDSLEMLFDTGATLMITDSAAAIVGTNRSEVGTSFIIESIYEKWKQEHPEWRVIKNAERKSNADIIEVPEIAIAGFDVGPVWFTVRPDNNFTGYMSQWMDKQIEGAVGGSAFKYFEIIVDYPNSSAEFIKPD